MKRLITLVIILMSLGVNTVTAQKYLQDSKTQQITIPLRVVDLQFEKNVPTFLKNDELRLTEAIQTGKSICSNKRKGKYDTFVLYYTTEVYESILSATKIQDTVYKISYKVTQSYERQFAWWYVLWFLGLIAMRQLKKTDNAYYATFALICVIIGMITTHGIFSFAITFAFLSLFSFVIADKCAPIKKTKQFAVTMYCVCIITAIVFAYYQV